MGAGGRADALDLSLDGTATRERTGPRGERRPQRGARRGGTAHFAPPAVSRGTAADTP